MSRIVFNADDYGLTAGVSRGILQASEGVVQSTTVMANLVSEPDLQNLMATSMTAGIHLNLSLGRPLSDNYPAQLLDGEGRFLKSLALDEDTWRDVELRRAVAMEWTAQFELLKRRNLEISHIDSHHHTHMLGPLFPMALEMAVGFGLPLRCRSEYRGLAEPAGVAGPEVLIEGYFGTGNISRDSLLGMLEVFRGRHVEVMCHPGCVDDELRVISSYVDERGEELSVLGDPALRRQLEEDGWTVSGYSLRQPSSA
ncbi:MAG: ChbG/HpnK family deacetylase [Planctomycetales bacterium]|nr:ChbG/HpnK family deacetylase [bacterium]UNM09983.1 MAG: ChbG/HpnK family deacetylase [Planctomycetales bacterium]